MKVVFYFLMIYGLVISCNNSGISYDKIVKEELASGRRSDSIFLNLYLGMPKKDFMKHCWEMNQKGLFMDGGFPLIQYDLKNNELNYPASMRFFPDFVNDKISAMSVNFQYDGWAPWNKHLTADSLLPHVASLFKKWNPAGRDFIQLQDSIKQNIYIKIDGNRRIVIRKHDEQFVKVDIADLLLLPADDNKKIK